MAEPERVLALIDQARCTLLAVQEPREAALLVRQADAIKHLAAKALASAQVQNQAAEVALRARRRAGELLEDAGFGEQGGDRRSRPRVGLEDFGVDRHDSQRWRSLADIPSPEFEAYLTESAELTTAGALALAKRLKQLEENAYLSTAPPPAIEGTFRVITADPPWQYDNRATRAAAEDHYPTLSVAELCDLQVSGRTVEDCAADGAHLYLWTTNAFLRDAFTVLESWGFEYKTCLTWVKPQLGIGNYFRSMTEHVLFGVRGTLRVIDGDQPNWFEARRGQHSRKPDAFYELVERVSPGPYLELFGRSDRLLGPRKGWTVWGNEA